MLKVLEFVDEHGESPFRLWLTTLEDVLGRAKVVTALNRMEQGNLGDAKSVGSGVWERRIDFGPGYRLYFGRDGKKLIILLCGGTKKRQARDIESAKNYWAAYKRRKRSRSESQCH